MALSRGDVAQYVDALFLVYLILIFSRIVLSWIQQFRPIPYNPTLRSAIGFVEGSVDPYLNLFRRVLPPIGGGGMAIDLSPILGILLLLLVQGIVVGAIAG